RGSYFGASRFTYATACQVARPPLTDRTRSPRPQRALTSRLPAVWSPSLPLDITTTWTGLLVLAGLAPAGMAASRAAPDPDEPNSSIRLLPWVFDGEALIGPGMKDAWRGKPVVGQFRHPIPREAVLLAAAPERSTPEVGHVMPERRERPTLSRLNGWPARSPADASPTSSRMLAHGLGPMWAATPSSRWTCTTYSLPVSRRTRVKRRSPPIIGQFTVVARSSAWRRLRIDYLKSNRI